MEAGDDASPPASSRPFIPPRAGAKAPVPTEAAGPARRDPGPRRNPPRARGHLSRRWEGPRGASAPARHRPRGEADVVLNPFYRPQGGAAEGPGRAGGAAEGPGHAEGPQLCRRPWSKPR